MTAADSLCHFSTPDGVCRDTVNLTACLTKASGAHEDADSSTLLWLRRAMDQARPDLIVLTGDQLNGQSSSWSAYSAMLKVARLFESRKVPWCVSAALVALLACLHALLLRARRLSRSQSTCV